MFIQFVATVEKPGKGACIRLLSVLAPSHKTMANLGFDSPQKRLKCSESISKVLGSMPTDGFFCATFRLVKKNMKFHSIVPLERYTGYDMSGKVFLAFGTNKVPPNFPYFLKERFNSIHDGFGYILPVVHMSLVNGGRALGNLVIPIPLTNEEADALIVILNDNGFNVTAVSANPSDGAVVTETVADDVSVVKVEEEKPVLVPEKYFYISDETRAIVSASLRNLVGFGGDNKAVNIMLMGDSGNGKTSLAKEIAARLKFDFEVVNCALLVEPEDIAVRRDIVGGSTVVRRNPFFQKVEKGNCVVLLDELNRVPPNVLNPLLSLLDWRREETFLGEKLVVGNNVVFIASMNVGPQFTGTFQSDNALFNRFLVFINVDIPPLIEEERILIGRGATPELAAQIVGGMNRLRLVVPESGISVRTTLGVFDLVKGGLSIRDASQAVIVNPLAAEERKTMVDAVNGAFGAIKSQKTNKFII